MANCEANNMGMLWVKVLHILFVVAWFAGLFYLPRIYVNLAQNKDHEPAYTVLIGMAQRLYRFMLPLAVLAVLSGLGLFVYYGIGKGQGWIQDRKSTRLNSSHVAISYAVFCLKKKKNK